MTITPLVYKLSPYSEAELGKGAYCIVYRATEQGSGKQVAIKKSRVSRTVKRPSLQHESRMLQLLKGHAAIPSVYGYGQLDHFEYISMELLGPSITAQMKDGAGLKVETVIRIVDQALAALQHIHELGIVHRDIKPENLLRSLYDPSTIKVIDFGMSKPFSRDQPTKYDPLNDRRPIVGSLYWASLNSHNGLDLAPRDDLESLALVALYLLRGSLPWKPRPRGERLLLSQEIIRLMKQSCSGPELSAGFPKEFGEFLSYCRSMTFHQFPDYNTLRCSFASPDLSDGFSKEVSEHLLCSQSTQSHQVLEYNALSPSFAEKKDSVDNAPLDWTPCYPNPSNPILDEPTISDNEDEKYRIRFENDSGEDTYFGWDIDIWNRHGNRDKDVTLPSILEAEFDRCTPLIAEVHDDD